MTPPLMLLPRHDCVQQVDGEWLVCRCIPNHEKRVVESLAKADEPFFFPWQPEERMWGGRRRTVDMPMLGGYVFVTTTARELLNGETVSRHLVGGPSRYINVTNRRQFVNDLTKLQIISDAAQRRDENSRINALFHPLRIKGKRVRVIAGALEGLEGEVISWNGKKAILQVSVILLGQACDMEIDEAFLESL